jgi:hypothetical protein
MFILSHSQKRQEASSLLVTEECYWALFNMPLYTFLHNFLNVQVQIANTIGLQKKITSKPQISFFPGKVPESYKLTVCADPGFQQHFPVYSLWGAEQIPRKCTKLDGVTCWTVMRLLTAVSTARSYLCTKVHGVMSHMPVVWMPTTVRTSGPTKEL